MKDQIHARLYGICDFNIVRCRMFFVLIIPRPQASNIKVMANAICESFRIAPYDLRYFVSLRNKSFKRNNCVFIHHYF